MSSTPSPASKDHAYTITSGGSKYIVIGSGSRQTIQISTERCLIIPEDSVKWKTRELGSITFPVTENTEYRIGAKVCNRSKWQANDTGSASYVTRYIIARADQKLTGYRQIGRLVANNAIIIADPSYVFKSNDPDYWYYMKHSHMPILLANESPLRETQEEARPNKKKSSILQLKLGSGLLDNLSKMTDAGIRMSGGFSDAGINMSGGNFAERTGFCINTGVKTSGTIIAKNDANGKLLSAFITFNREFKIV